MTEINGLRGAAYRGRFAPSPTGDLHFGSLVAALGSWFRARAAGGTWLVRVEDIDPPREVAGSAARILETLARFGMSADEPVLYQSTRRAAYEQALDALRGRGAVFACACSRRQLEASGGIHHEPCRAEPSEPGAQVAWRVRAPDREIAFVDVACGTQSQNLAREVGDYVLKRADGWHAYQLAVVVDDAAQGVTEVARGADLLDSTPRQIHLQELLALPTPRYLHLPLVVDAQGRKLSKQLKSLPIDPTDPWPALERAAAYLGVTLARGAGPIETRLLRAAPSFAPATIAVGECAGLLPREGQQ